MRKGLVFVLILFFLFFLSDKCVFALGNISGDSSSSEVSQLETFQIAVSGDSLDSNSSYYVKFRLGTSDMNEGETLGSDGQTWLWDSSAWESFPVATTDGGGILLNFLISVRAKTSSIPGQNSYTVRIKKIGSSVNIDSVTKTINVLGLPSPTPTNTPFPSATPTPFAKYIINDVKNSGGTVLNNSVEIYVDGVNVHHEPPETLIFCPGCSCSSYVACGLGSHTITLKKSGYNDWSETVILEEDDSQIVDPVMSLVVTPIPTSTITLSPTPTKIPSITLAPTKINTPIPENLPTIFTSISGSPEVLGEEVASSDSEISLKPTQGNKTENKPSGDFSSLIPIGFIVAGACLVGGSGYMFFKSKKDLVK